jgi:hypothetical protein
VLWSRGVFHLCGGVEVVNEMMKSDEFVLEVSVMVVAQEQVMISTSSIYIQSGWEVQGYNIRCPKCNKTDTPHLC